MLHLLMGNGKGKTSSAAGAAVRAAGHGKKVIFAQFLKDGSSGEIQVLKKLPEVTVITPEINYGFTFQMTPEQLSETAGMYEKMLDGIRGSDAFLIVLDEILHALNAGLVKKEQLISLLDSCKDSEFILTGYDPPDYLIERADYISEMKKIRHPFDKGVTAREGIEY